MQAAHSSGKKVTLDPDVIVPATVGDTTDAEIKARDKDICHGGAPGLQQFLCGPARPAPVDEGGGGDDGGEDEDGA